MRIKKLTIEGFKGFGKEKGIEFSDLTLLFGENSSGKSTTLQSLMMLKQTCESGGGTFDLLTNGKYVTLGNWEDIVHRLYDDSEGERIRFAIDLPSKNDELNGDRYFSWGFESKKEGDEVNVNGIAIKSFSYGSEEDESVFLRGENKELVNECDSNLSLISVEKLVPQKVTYKFIGGFIKVLSELIYELYEIVYEKSNPKKLKKLKKDFDLKTEGSTFMDSVSKLMLHYFGGERLNLSKPSDKTSETVNELVELVDKIDREIVYDWGKDSLVGDITVLIIMSSQIKDLEEIVQRYEEKYNQVIEECLYEIKEIELNANTVKDIRKFDDILRVYYEKMSIRSFFRGIKYLGPLRERPRGTYDYDADSDPSYVGKFGQNLPYILTHFKDVEIEAPLPDGNIQMIPFGEALMTWLNYLNIADEVFTDTEHGIELNIIDKGVKAKIFNVGVGVSQVLPVLVMGLLSEEDDLLLYEQPELHLHPFAQSKLIDFFVGLIKCGRQIIIETHSEYFLHRLRYLILDERVSEEQVGVQFFEKGPKEVNVRKGELSSEGDFKYPKNFKDATEDLIRDILGKKIERM